MLSGQTVLVVEEEFLIALDIQRMLEERNAEQTIFARSAEDAFAQRSHWQRVGLAIIEVRVGAELAFDLVREIAASGIPVVICTGDASLRRGVPELPGLPVVLKPMLEQELANAMQQALASPG